MNRSLFITLIFAAFAWSNNAKLTPKPAVKNATKPATAAEAPKACTPSGVAPPTVGPGYSDPKFCCPGNIIIIQKTACAVEHYGGFAGLCAPCGNNKCDTEWEDKCNCPEDCSLMAAPPVKSSSSSSTAPIKK